MQKQNKMDYEITIHDDSIDFKHTNPHKQKHLVDHSNVDFLEVKPGALPWDEESMTFSRDEGASLIHLQRENEKLRNKLKELSEKLNHQIDLAESRRKKSKPQKKRTGYEELETAKKKLALCENQFETLSTRINLLKDPEYERKLKEDIENNQRKLREIEVNVQRNAAMQSKRGKFLGNLLDTGESPDTMKSFMDLMNERKILICKIEKIDQKNSQVTSSFYNFSEKCNQFEELYRELSRNQDQNYSDSGKIVKEEVVKLEKANSIKEKELKSKVKRLINKIKDLETEDINLDYERDKLIEEIREKEREINQAHQNIAKLRFSDSLMIQKSSSMTRIFPTELNELGPAKSHSKKVLTPKLR
ncbi:unnamed protein product [Blepharisma stoltei]|uniref:Uncharacterized protein n=1 Tax=Blepharisma stoltei TaxID=1481888 RepID=A0AAU9II10_9CILI|nr:unnamed protein product [Blepharisma stoltei]